MEQKKLSVLMAFSPDGSVGDAESESSTVASRHHDIQRPTVVIPVPPCFPPITSSKMMGFPRNRRLSITSTSTDGSSPFSSPKNIMGSPSLLAATDEQSPREPVFLPRIPSSQSSSFSSQTMSPKEAFASQDIGRSPRTARIAASVGSSTRASGCCCALDSRCQFSGGCSLTEHLERDHKLRTTILGPLGSFSTKVGNFEGRKRVNLAILVKSELYGTSFLWYLERSYSAESDCVRFSVAVYTLDDLAPDGIRVRLVLRVGEKKVRWLGSTLKCERGKPISHSERIANGEGVTFQFLGKNFSDNNDLQIRVDTTLDFGSC